MSFFQKENEQERTKRNDIKSFIRNENERFNSKISRDSYRENREIRISNSHGLDYYIRHKKSNNLVKLIYSRGNLAYYFDIKPQEF